MNGPLGADFVMPYAYAPFLRWVVGNLDLRDMLRPRRLAFRRRSDDHGILMQSIGGEFPQLLTPEMWMWTVSLWTLRWFRGWRV